MDEVPRKRTDLETVKHMQQCLKSDKPIYGIKKPSCLINLLKFDIISGFVPDAMHCINLGIAEQFSNYWFGSNNLPYSLSANDVKKIDNFMSKIKVPKQIMRLSRPLAERKYWKAKEWENWVSLL